ncbi:MAG: DNA replication/repair protein RecF [Deltaproteobacteria bacterium]|nr:DNA replication/repair protein RecF [Deltaproteobacteria bacterium]
MYIRGLYLRNFRNIQEASFQFHPHFNLLVGANAQGKTNVIEAAHFLAFGRSFRVSDFRGLICWGQDEGIIRCELEIPAGSEERKAHLTVDKKRMFKNGKPATPNQFESMPLVLFAPEEILLLKDSPQARRDYIDGFLSKIVPGYSKNLANYKRALLQRNKLLKDENVSNSQKQDQMVFWEAPLLENGLLLVKERILWISRLNEKLVAHYNIIAGNTQKKAQFLYEPNANPENFSELQQKRREEEIERQTTLVGPHRDDLRGVLNGEPIVSFGSQGEMRTFTLSLKLSEITLFEEVLGRHPIFLLDDVASELDENRNAYFFAFLKNYKGQLFATATSLSLFPKGILEPFSAWRVEDGKATPI